MVIHQLDLFGNPVAIPIVKEEPTKAQSSPKNEASKEDTAPKSLPLFEEEQTPDSIETGNVSQEKKASSSANGAKPNAAPEASDEVVYSDNNIVVRRKKGRPKMTEEERAAKPAKVPGKGVRPIISDVDAATALLNVPDDETLNQKMYYRISVVAKWFGVNNSLIRYWENEFDILKPRLTRKGDRLFRVEDVKNLQLIYQLLKVRKFSVEGAKKYLNQNKQKADAHLELTESLTKIRTFLSDLKATLGQQY